MFGRFILSPRRIVTGAFLLIGLCGAIYLGTQTIAFIQEARVAVNIGTDSTNAPTQRIVNKLPFTPPQDGRLRLDQLEMMARVIESSDSLPPSTAQSMRTKHIIELLNEYTVSLTEYRWIRTTVATEVAASTRGVRIAQSPLGDYYQVMMGMFLRHRAFFRDSLDEQLL